MRSSCLATVVTALIVAVSGAYAQSPALRGGAMLDCSGLPCVDVSAAQGRHLRLLVDTGNANSVLDTAVAKDMGLVVTPVNDANGKPIPGYGRSVLTGLTLGDASLGEVKVLVADLASYIKRDRVPACDGTLSYAAFKNRILELDYKRQTVRFSALVSQDFPCGGFCGDLSYPTFGKKGPPIVVATGFSINGQPLTVQIDTLFSGTMLVYSSSVAKLKLTSQSASSKKQFFKYTDEGVEMIEGQAETEAFGSRVLAQNVPVFFPTPAVHEPDAMFDGTVGVALLKGMVLTLDLHSNHAWIM